MKHLLRLTAFLLALGVSNAQAYIKYTDVTLTPDTSIFASADVIDASTVVPDFFPSDRPAILYSVEVIDEDDQGAAFDIYFNQNSAALGTENSAASISDANARGLLGYVAVATADYKDLGGVRIAYKTGLNLPMAPAAGERKVYIGVINGSGTPTYTASGLKLRLGVWEPDRPADKF